MAAKKSTGKSASRSSSARARQAAAKKKAQEAELRRYILIVLISAVTIIAYMRMGLVGVVLNNVQRFLFGRFYFIVMGVILLQIAILIINGKTGKSAGKNPYAIILILVMLGTNNEQLKSLFGRIIPKMGKKGEGQNG